MTLLCHPQTPGEAIRAIGVLVGVAPDGIVSAAFVLEGDPAGLRIPAARPSRRAERLWQHTCFEVFVMAGQGPGYREFNFSPSGEWALYGFRSYRDGGELATEGAPDVAVRRTANRLELDARISADLLPQGRPLRLGLAAVVEDKDGALSYWALRHPSGKPDFHHADAFALQLR